MTLPGTETWGQGAAQDLKEQAKRLSIAPQPFHLGEARIPFGALHERASAEIERIAADHLIDRDRCLYVISLDNDADEAAVMAAYVSARATGRLKLPQNNSTSSRTLYVGSSCATANRKRTLKSRLRQHLVSAPQGTYALSLAEWAEDLSGGIVVNAWQYGAEITGMGGDSEARKIVLAVEDWLARKLDPLLGRRGSRH